MRLSTQKSLKKPPSPHENIPSPGKTSITAGAINETDLAKFFNGRRKLPAWKESRFHQHLNQSKIEDLCSEIGIDALAKFQESLASYGITVKTVDEIPAAVFHMKGLTLDESEHQISFTKNRDEGRYGYLKDVYDVGEGTDE